MKVSLDSVANTYVFIGSVAVGLESEHSFPVPLLTSHQPAVRCPLWLQSHLRLHGRRSHFQAHVVTGCPQFLGGCCREGPCFLLVVIWMPHASPHTHPTAHSGQVASSKPAGSRPSWRTDVHAVTKHLLSLPYALVRRTSQVLPTPGEGATHVHGHQEAGDWTTTVVSVHCISQLFVHWDYFLCCFFRWFGIIHIYF